MDTTISTVSSDGAWDAEYLTRKFCDVLNLGECPEWIDGLETGATEGVGATPAQQPKQYLADAARYLAEHESDSAELAALRARVAEVAKAMDAAFQRVGTVASGDYTKPEMIAPDIAYLARLLKESRARVATLESDLDAANRTWSVRVSVPDAVDHRRLIGTTLVDIGHSDRVYIVESDEISRAFARIRTLEAEVPPGYAKLPSGEVVPVLGWFWRTKDGAIVARTDERVYVCEGLDGYTRWSGKVVPTLFCNWLNKSDSGWQGNPTASMKFAAPDGGWHCWSTREACEAAIAARAATSPIGGVA